MFISYLFKLLFHVTSNHSLLVLGLFLEEALLVFFEILSGKLLRSLVPLNVAIVAYPRATFFRGNARDLACLTGATSSKGLPWVYIARTGNRCIAMPFVELSDVVYDCLLKSSDWRRLLSQSPHSSALARAKSDRESFISFFLVITIGNSKKGTCQDCRLMDLMLNRRCAAS